MSLLLDSIVAEAEDALAVGDLHTAERKLEEAKKARDAGQCAASAQETLLEELEAAIRWSQAEELYDARKCGAGSQQAGQANRYPTRPLSASVYGVMDPEPTGAAEAFQAWLRSQLLALGAVEADVRSTSALVVSVLAEDELEAIRNFAPQLQEQDQGARASPCQGAEPPSWSDCDSSSPAYGGRSGGPANSSELEAAKAAAIDEILAVRIQ